MQDQLKNVRQKATSSAFVAILFDGSVMTWGNADYGGQQYYTRLAEESASV